MGRVSVIVWIFWNLFLMVSSVKAWSPTGVPNSSTPLSLMLGTPLSRGSSPTTWCGNQTVDLGREGGWTVAEVDR